MDTHMRRRQGRCGDRAANSLEVLVGEVETNVADLGELLCKDLLGLVTHHHAASSCRDRALEEDVIDGVVLGVLSQGVAQVDADGLVQQPHAGVRLLVRVLHGSLDDPQQLVVRFVVCGVHVGVIRAHVRRHIKAGECCELRCPALAQVEVGEASVARGPGIGRRHRVQVELRVGQSIDPTQQFVLLAVTGSHGAAHADGKDIAVPDHQGASNR
mmetsp:Transcript_27926/g.76782  ORF Transcript_27926/g.76782 Transcript_27926/m.76782 type:complete len:214 (+) Transcript_27926:118-759(+)